MYTSPLRRKRTLEDCILETKARALVQRRRFTVEEYHKMAEAGILHEDDRVELIDGEIIQMNPIGSRHMRCVNELNWLLSRRLGDEVRVSVQNPVRLDGDLEPQPDLAVIRTRDYAGELPGPEDVLLLLEVSDTTLRYDREVKLPTYARAGILETWIVDLLAGKTIERHNDPSGDGYRRTQRARPGEALASESLPEIVLQVHAVLGQR